MLKKQGISALAAILVVAGGYFVYAHWAVEREQSRESLLRQLPVTATSIIYVDVAQLRAGDFLKSLAKWAASSTEDPEYQAFTKETGFDYERDLNQLAIALEAHESKRTYFAIADGRFDRNKL